MIKFQIRGDYCPLLSCAKSSEPNRRTQTDRRTEGLGQEHMAGGCSLTPLDVHCGDTVSLVVLLQAQLLLVQVHRGGIDTCAL